MRWLNAYELQLHEPIRSSSVWQDVQTQLRKAVDAIVWPPQNTSFTINPQRHGNGVVPIKKAFIDTLKLFGWKTEQPVVPNVGEVDAALETSLGTFAVEWETGNISSSHRSLNRLALGLYRNTLVGGILVLPSRNLYNHLTDRIGNLQELAPYFPLYRLLPLTHGVLIVVEIEHDQEDSSLPLIAKGTDGWALIKKTD